MTNKKATEDNKELMAEWKAKAEAVKTEDELIAFIRDMVSYDHDYGSIVHAIFNGMNATMNFINRSPAGGITGFQAGCLGHMCIQEYLYIKPPYRILDFNNLLYPQYEDKFEKVISREVWEDLRKKAAVEYEKFGEHGSERVKSHLKSVADGVIPFGFEVKDEQ